MTLRSTFALAVLLLAGCAGRDVAPNAAPLALAFTWAGTQPCGFTSPELRIAGAPPATTRFAVRLVDLDMPSFNHGGGEVARPAGDVIAAGALTDGYRGPCPPSPHSYRFTVQAVDAQNRVIALGEATRTFPP